MPSAAGRLLDFSATPLFSGAALSVAAGDRICLVGRIGSGKSMLLRIAAGFVEPDAGDAFTAKTTAPNQPWQTDFTYLKRP